MNMILRGVKVRRLVPKVDETEAVLARLKSEALTKGALNLSQRLIFLIWK